MSIFGSAASGGSLGSTSGNRHSIELKAGRMNLVDSDQGGVKKKMVHPDSRYITMIVQKKRGFQKKFVYFQKGIIVHLFG